MEQSSTGKQPGGIGAETPGHLPPMATQFSPIFPSTADLQNLRRLLREAKFLWAGLTSTQRWHYHAYDYAFLRVRHGMYNLSYPLDPQGLWFNAVLVEAAECLYKPLRRPYSARVRPADVPGRPELSSRLRAQDAERDALRRQVQTHGERMANGEVTPEMLAFMKCCARQVEDNGRTFDERNRKTFGPEARMTQRQINAALGVTATEQKPPAWEDPEDLRRGRVALGLEHDLPEERG
jgi:hypothetical protein